LLSASVGVVSNVGAAHPPANFVAAMTPTGSTGTSFLLGIAVSVVASLALWLLLTLPRLATTTQAVTT